LRNDLMNMSLIIIIDYYNLAFSIMRYLFLSSNFTKRTP
jgi:hypothetical protein